MVNDWAQRLVWTSISYAALAGICLAMLVGVLVCAPGVRRRLLPIARLRPGNWTGLDVLLTFIASQITPYVIFSVLYSLGFFQTLIGPAPDQATGDFQKYAHRCMNIASPLILAASLGVIFTFLFARRGLRPHHYGLSWARWPANLILGLVVFVLATPLIYAINVLVTFYFPPSDHALTQLGKQNLEPWEWALLAFQASVAAPLLEEIVFRGILLGWLRRASLQGHLTVCVMTVFFAMDRSSVTGDVWSYVWPILFAICLVAGYGYILVRMVKRFGLNEDEIRAWRLLPGASDSPALPALFDDEAKAHRQQLREQNEKRAHLWAEANADLAILGSAILFAAVHSQNWPAPMPLVVLGLALGWLAMRTQSLIGPIVLHALFNLVAFLTLYALVFVEPPANGNAQTTPARPSVTASITTSVPASQLPLRK